MLWMKTRCEENIAVDVKDRNREDAGWGIHSIAIIGAHSIEEPDDLRPCLTAAQGDDMATNAVIERAYLRQCASDQLTTGDRQGQIYDHRSTATLRRFTHPLNNPV